MELHPRELFFSFAFCLISPDFMRLPELLPGVASVKGLLVESERSLFLGYNLDAEAEFTPCFLVEGCSLSRYD